MMGKIPKSGRSFKGCVEYCMLKKDAEVLEAHGVRTGEVAQTIADFNMQRKMRPGLGQAVGHIALNWSPEDGNKLTNELMIQVAKEYMKMMKIENTQFLIVRHHDTDHDHLHIVYNRVDNYGKTVPDSGQRWKNVRVSKALTKKHGFHIGIGKQAVKRQQLKGADKAKYQIYDLIKALIPKVANMDELQKLLAKQGIEMLLKYKSGTDQVQGISFKKGDYKFKGSEIDRSFSYSKLSNTIAEQSASKSLATEIREIIAKSDTVSGDVRSKQPDIKYQHEDAPLIHRNSESLEINITDDVDDEAVHRKNRNSQAQVYRRTR